MPSKSWKGNADPRGRLGAWRADRTEQIGQELADRSRAGYVYKRRRIPRAKKPQIADSGHLHARPVTEVREGKGAGESRRRVS